MDHIDERTKKLKAGKEKLAAFLKKKSKAKKTDKEDKDATGPQNEEEQGFPEVSSPSAFSNTDSDQFSFTSGDEWSTEESELKTRMLYGPELADVEQNVVNTERSRHTLDSYILQSSSSEQNIISDIESALSKRDELISKLTESLQASFWQNIPNDEVMTQVQALVEHVGTLQTQLLQADQTLQEQLELHEASALALQAAKEQMLQLQFILNCKDAELDRIIKTVHKNTQSIHSYGMKETNTENCQGSCLMCEQYSDKVRILEQELYNKIRECERWSCSQQEWLAREQNLLSSVSVKSQESILFQESHQLREHDIMHTCGSQQTSTHEQKASNGNGEQLHILEFQLAKLKHEHHTGAGDISQPSFCGPVHNEYATQHSQCLSQIEHLTSLNLDLQEKLSSLSSVEKDLDMLRCEYEKLSASYQEEIQTKFHHSEPYAQPNAMYSSEKDILIAKITELQDEVARLQTVLHSSAADVNSSETTLIAQLQRELMQKDDDLRVSLTQLTEVQAVSNKLRCSYESLETTVRSYEEVIAGLTQQLQAAEHGQKDAELEVMTQQLKIEQVFKDVQNRLKDKDLECKQYTENIIKLQDELLSNQHVYNVEISEKEQQLESITDHMTVLDSERAKLMEKVKHLEHRLKMECQQYMDNLQHVMAEKDVECKQYTENIVRLQDELMSFRHAHDIEISEKNYYFERAEEQMEVLSTEKANLEQRVMILEHKLAASYQPNIEDVSDVKHEMEIFGSNVIDVKIQNELLTTHSDNKMLEKVSHTERFEEEVVLTTETTVLSQTVNILEQELHAQCKHMKDTEEAKAEIESQLQVVLADRENLQNNVDALTTEMFFLKKNLQDSHSEHKRSVNQDLISEHSGSIDNLDSTTETEQVQGLHSYLYEVRISDSENKDQLHTSNLTLHDMVGKFEYERKLAIQCLNETEQLKARISVIDMNEERHTKAALLAIVDDLFRAQVEFSQHIESLVKQMVGFETQGLEKSSCQAELLEQKQAIQSEPDQEICQEALQAQLKSTISQWQRLQVIVQEKEIELHRLQENFDEQQRINSSMMRFHEEQRHLHLTEIESLKTAIEQKNKADIQIGNQQYDSQSSVDNVSTELNEIINKVSDNETALNNDGYIAQMEIELSNLKTLLAMKESENYELVSSLTLFQEEIVNLKNRICDLQQHDGKTIQDNMKQKENEVGILEDSLYGNIEEKEIDLINWKIISESQIRDLKSVITEKESEIDKLKLVNADIFSENTSVKNQLEARDVTVSDLKSCLANTASEVNVLNNAIAGSKAETEHLKHQLASKEFEVDVLRSTIAAMESDMNVLKEAFALKRTEINALQHHFENVKSESTALKSILADKEFKMDALTLSLTDSKSDKDLNLKRSDSEQNASTGVLGNVKVDGESEQDTSKEILDEAKVEINVLALTEREPEISSLQQQLLHTETLLGELTKDCALKNAEIEIQVASLADRNCEIHSLKSCLSVEEVKIVNVNKGFPETHAGELDSAEANDSLAQTAQIISLQSTLKDNEAQVLELKIKLSEKESEILSLKKDLTNRNSEMLKFKESLEVKEHETSDFKNKVTETLSEVDHLQENLKNKDDMLYSATQGKYDAITKLATSELQLEEDGNARKIIAQESETDMLTERLFVAENQNIIFQTIIKETNKELVAMRNYITQKESESMVLKDKLSEIVSQNDMLQDAVTQTDEELADMKQIIMVKEVEVSSLGRIDDAVCYRDELQTTASEVDLEMNRLKQSLAEKEFEISTLKVDLNETKNQIQTMQATFHQGDAVLEKDSQIQVLTEKLIESEIKTDAFKTSLDETEDRLIKLRNIVGEKDSEIHILTSKVSDAISQLDLLQSDLIKKDEELAALRQAVLEKESEICIMTERFDGYSSQFDALNNLSSNTNKELADMVKSVEEKESEICSLKEALCEASKNESQVLILSEELSKATNKVDSLNKIVHNKSEELATIHSTLENRSMEIRSLNEQLQEVSSQMDVLNTDFRNMNEELIAVKSTSENKDIEISSLKEQLQEASSQMDALNMELEKTNEEMAITKSSLENKDMEICSLNEQLQEAISNVSVLHSSLRHADEEVTSIKTSLENKDLEIKSLSEKLQDANRYMDSLNADLTKANEDLAAIQNTIENKDMGIITLNEKLQEANSCVSTQQTDLKIAHEELAALQSCLENKDLEMIDLTDKLQEANSCVDILRNDLENTNEELVAIKVTLVTKTLEISASNEQLQESNSNVQMLHTDLKNAVEELTAIKRSLENRDLEVNDLKEQLQEANSQVDALHTDLRNAHEDVEVIKSSLENKDLEISSLKKQIEQLQEDSSNVDVLQGILKNTNEELAAIKTILQNKDVEMSTLNEQLQEGTSQVDVLNTELLKSSEELTAIKSILGNKDMEINILNEKLQEAKIQMDIQQTDLKYTNEIVQATQISFENKEMEINTLNEKLQESNSHVEALNAELKMANEELAAIKNTLGNKDMEIVTLNERIQEGKSHVGKLYNDLENANEAMAALKSELEKRDMEVNSLHSKLQESSSNVDILHVNLKDTHEELATQNNNLESCSLEISNLNEQLHKANSQVDVLLMDLRNANEELIAVKSTSENKDIEMSSLKEQLQETSEHVDVLNAELKKANVEVAAIKSSLENKDMEINILNERLQEANGNVSELHSSLRHADEEVTSIKTSLENKDLEIKSLNENLQEANRYVDSLNADLTRANEELTAIQNTIDNKDMEIITLNEKLQEANNCVSTQQTDFKIAHEELAALQSCLENKDLEMIDLTDKLQEANSCVDILRNDLQNTVEELVAIKSTIVNKTLEISVSNEQLKESNSNVQKLYSDLRNANEELAAAKSNLENTDLEIDNLNEQLQDVSNQVDVLLMDFRNANTELIAVKSTSENKDLEISSLKRQLQEASSQMDALNMELKKTNEEMTITKSSLENKDTEICSLNEQLQEAISNVSVLHSSLRHADEEVTSIKTSLENKDLEINILNEQLQEAISNVSELQSSLRHADEEATSIKTSLENKDLEINTLSEKLQEASSLVDSLNADLTKANEEQTEIQNTIENKDMEIITLNEKLQEANNCVSTQQTDLKIAHEELAALQSCLENKDLEMIDLTDKLQEANSCVDILRNDLQNTVEELVAIKSTIVNKTLEISVSNEQLKESNSNVQKLHSDLRNANEELAAAKSSLENTDLEIDNLNTQLQEVSSQVDVLLMDLRNANTELIAVKSTSENKDLEISSLKRQLQEASSQVDALNTELIKANEEVETLKSSLENTAWETHKLNQELQEANHKVDVLCVDLRNANEQLEAVKNTLENKELEINTFSERVQESDKSVGILQTDLRNANEELMVLNNCITEKESEICTLKEELSMKESKVSNLSEELSKASSKVEELLLTQTSMNEDLETVNQSLLMNESEMAALKEKLSETSIQISSLTTALSIATDELAEMKGCVDQKESEISALTERHTEAVSQLNILNSNLITIDEDLKAARDSEIAAESRCTQLEQKLCNCLSQNEAMQTSLKEHEESLAVVSNEKNEFHMLVLTLQDQLEALGVNLHELKAEHSGLKLTLDVSRESKDHMESSIMQKERELSELTSQVTSLEQQIKKLSHDAEIRDTAEKLQKTEFKAKEEEFEHLRVELLQEIKNLKKFLGEKESAITELTALATTAKSEYLLQELNIERKSLTLEATLSATSQEAQEISATIVLQELKLQEQTEEISQLTDKLNHASEQLQEINEMNISLHQLNEALNSESHAHLTDIIHQREALEQQVVEMEGLLAQKEREISEIMQSAADNKMTLEQLSIQHLALSRNYKTLLSTTSHLQTEIIVKESTLIEQKQHIDEQSVKLSDLSETLTQVTLSVNEVNELNIALKAEIDALQENKCDLEHRMSKLQSEFDSQELTATQFMVESKQLTEKLTQMTYDLDTKDATIFDLQHDCDMYIKEINHLKQELEQKDLISISLKQDVESSCSLMERSREEKEMLKANFDSCMEEVQQKLSDQEMELKRLRAQLAEETKNVCQDQNQMKEIYEQQIGQMEEKLLQCEKHCERLEKELNEVKVKAASAKDVYEHQLSEQELHLQSTNSELLKLKDHLSKITSNHKCEIAGLKRLHEIQTNELEESCLTLERTVAEQKRLVNENTARFNRERCDLEQNYEIQLSDVEEKRRVSEMEISRLKKHLDEMKFDHEKDMQSLEKSCEARLYELEDKYCNATNELERLRKTLFTAGGYSEERQALEMRVEELETLRRDLQNGNSLLEDDIAMMRTQAQSREEEMKAVLKNAAEEQQRKTAELNSEILQLQQHLSECDHKHAETMAEIRRQCESQVTEIQSRNRQLEEQICSLEILIEEDSAQRMAGNKHESHKKRNMSAHVQEGTSLKMNVSSLNSPERSSTFSTEDPQFSPIDLETFPSDDHSLVDCLPPSNENLLIVEGFVAEPTVKFISPRRVSQPNAASGYSASVEKADFVEEQCDGFQLEIPEQSDQCSDHPIHENVIRERFEPEAPDHFLLETLEEPTNTMWQHKMSVDLSPSHIQSQQARFDFSTPEKPQRNEEFGMQDTLFSNFNTNCNNRDLQSTYQLEKPDVSFEKCLNDIKDELEEEYVTKMRQQEIKLTLEYEANQAEYKLEMEQHFSQRMKAVRYEWERKFNKALQKVKKELEKQHRKELRQLKSDQYQGQLHQHDPSVSPVAGESSLAEEDDLVSHDTEGTQLLSQVMNHLLQENQEITVPSDVLTRDIESTQTVETTAEKQPKIISGESSSSSSSTTSTPTLTACSPVVDRETGRDEAESSRSEVSDTSSARERFLEELEAMSQQSSQDLPLEWELTSTVIETGNFQPETGNFEREPEHQSVWEVFDGRCVRQDCQEVRHKFHTLYQWVLNLLGDGYDVAFDSEFKLLTELPIDESNSKSSSLNQSEIDSVNSSDSMTRVKDISYAELLARVVSLELTKHRLEEELVAQIDLNSKLQWEINKQYGVTDADLKAEVKQRRTTVQSQGGFSVRTFKESDTCTGDDLSNQSSCQGSDASDAMESLEKPRAQTSEEQQPQEMDNLLAGQSGVPASHGQSADISSAKTSEYLSCIQQDCYSRDDGSFLTLDGNISECRSDRNPVGNDREIIYSNIPENNYSNVILTAEHGSATSVSSNNILQSVYLEGAGNNSWSHVEILDLQDKELAEEISRLQQDLRETKEVFSKENFLLQEALHKDTVSKNLMIHTASERNVATNANASRNDSKLRKHGTEGNLNMLEQKLTICMEQNQMLEDENVSLRKQIREQAAIANFLKSRLQQKDQDTEVWQKSVNKQLITLQNQRCDLLQLLQDMDSGKESKLSDTLQGSLREESLRTAQEDLMARMEELDHLNKMLTQRQIELQHCEAEREHLEQLCLLKDETEMQLMKQKRLMEEQLAQIETHLTERETILMEEKTQLLQELKDKGFHLPKASEFSQTSYQSLSSNIPSLPVSGDMNLSRDNSATPVLSHSSSQSGVLSTGQDVDRQHSEAVEKLRAKLKQYKT